MTVSIARRHLPVGLLLCLIACSKPVHSPPTHSAPIGGRETPGIVTASPAAPAELPLVAGDSAIDVAVSPFAPQAAVLVRGSNGRSRVMRWTVGDTNASPIVDLPPAFEPHAIAAHPAATAYFVAGTIRGTGKSQILSIVDDSGTWKTHVVFETPRDIGRLIVGPRPFQTDSGPLYRLFFATRLANGGSSLRSVTERGGVEYQVVGPASEAVELSDSDVQPGGKTAPYGTPMAFHPHGTPLLWQDEHGCAHEYSYDQGWTADTTIARLPCGGSTSIAPNGAAYLSWRSGRPGLSVIGRGIATSNQATTYTFVTAPVSAPDGRGVIGIVAGANGRTAIAYVPVDVPLADVANAWQLPAAVCDAPLFAREGGLFRDADSTSRQLYAVYDRYNYSESRVPALATTDLFWDNFGAAFNGVFILEEKSRAMGAFWAFVDSANAALAQSAPTSKWAKAFAAIEGSRSPNATGEAELVARATGIKHSDALDTTFDFDELMPRGHYTSSAAMKQYFRAVHYLTEIGRKLNSADMSPLAALPANVQRSAWRWIDVYRPFISPSRRPLVWTGATAPPLAPYVKHPDGKPTVFPLSWGLDNEVLESTVMHSDWPLDEQVGRLLPSGVDVATAYGNAFARAVLSVDLTQSPRLGPVLAGISARRPHISESSSVYERWLDALGAEWADSMRFPGAPPSSRLWDVKRLQTGLASWATLREATILVNERPSDAEAGEGGFENLILEQPRGYVEPAPKTFDAIAGLYEALSRTVSATVEMEPGLRAGIVEHLDSSAARTRRFGAMAERERRGQPLSDNDYRAIQDVGGLAEHDFLIYKSLPNTDEGLPIPDPMPKIADVAGSPEPYGVLEAAVGYPLEWHQIVPYFGRREIVVGGVYSYDEFVSHTLYDNERWRKEIGQHPHPNWVQPMIAKPLSGCHADDAP